MCYVRSIYSLFLPPGMYWNSCRRFVAVFQFFPVLFPVKCKIPPGEVHMSFLWEHSLRFNELLSPVCTASTLMCPPTPFRWTESHCDCEKCVLCRDETCSPENSRDNNSQRSGRPRWSRRCGHASLPESFLNLLHFALPLSCSRGHLVSAKILSSKTIK